MTVARFAIEAADAVPEDLRRQRKAAEIGLEGVASARAAERTALLGALAPTRDRLASSSDVCIDAPLAADLERAAERPSQAADLDLRAARTCRSVDAVLRAASALAGAKRCPEAIAIVAEGWSSAPSSAWVPLMDRVAACSTAVSLRRNLAFAPPDVIEDYVGLLVARREEQQRQEREERAREAEERRASEAFSARSRCEAHCSQAESHCRTSCAASASCSSQCGALRSHCMAGCG